MCNEFRLFYLELSYPSEEWSQQVVKFISRNKYINGLASKYALSDRHVQILRDLSNEGVANVNIHSEVQIIGNVLKLEGWTYQVNNLAV